MLDIQFDIAIKSNNKDSGLIPKRSVRKKSSKELRYFVPLLENGDIIELNYSDALDDEVVNKYDYGVLIKYGHKGKSIQAILNAGILVRKASFSNFFKFSNETQSMHSYRDGTSEEDNSTVIVNFPANWIQLDVSRENCSGYSDFASKIDAGKNKIGVSIATALLKQIEESIAYFNTDTKSISLSYLNMPIKIAMRFCGKRQNDIYPKLYSLSYRLFIDVLDDCIVLSINNLRNIKDRKLLEIGRDSSKLFMDFYERIRSRHRYIQKSQINLFDNNEQVHATDIILISIYIVEEIQSR